MTSQSFIDRVIANPVKVTVGVLLVALFGCVALLRMPMQLTPEVQTPTITIETRWPGASPQEVEREIVMEQEDQLKSVEGIRKMSSESADSKGTITLEFNVGENMEEALLKVNSRLQQVPEYPEDADQPVISTSNAADRPIAWFILSPRRPTDEVFDDFEQRYPELKADLAPVRTAHNVGVAMLRLRLLGKDNEKFKELLPPEALSVIELRRFAEDEIEARFERVEGVSQSNVIGGLEDELQVVVDPEKLAARQITLADVRAVLRGQNQDTSAGDLWEGKRRWVVRALGQFTSPEVVERQLLAVRDGAPVYVRDVAKVRMGFKKPDGLVRRFGESSIAINCQRETGANVLSVMEGLRATNAELDTGLLKSRGLQLTQVYDETDYILSSVDLVRQNIFVGGALTMTVLMLFLHLGVRSLLVIPVILAAAIASAFYSPWIFAACLAVIILSGFWFARGALVVGMAIPVSIVGTFLVLGLLGRSMNVVSLAGMAFAVGMLVDNAVVVLENIFRRHSEGEAAFEAAARGAEEVWGAVIASTLTTVAVFLPVVFVEEEAGQLFRDIALAISAAVALSLVVSITVIPTAAARLFTRRDEDDDSPESAAEAKSTAKLNVLVRPLASIGNGWIGLIVGFNAWLQRGVLRRIGMVVGLVAMAVGLSYLFWPKVEYLPSGNRNLVFGILLPPPGYNLAKLMDLGESVEQQLRPYWDIDPNSAEAKELDYPAIGDFFFVARGRSVFMGLRAHEPERAGELINLVQQVSGNLPGTFAVAKQSSLFEQGLTAGRTIDVEITGPDLNHLVSMGGMVMGVVSGRLEKPINIGTEEDPILLGEPGTALIPDAQARPVPSLDLSSPEVHVKPKLVQAAEMGFSSQQVGFAADALVDGAYVTDYYLGAKKVDLRVLGEESYTDNTQDVEALPVATPSGQLVPLGALAEVSLTSGPEQINHRERVRAITIEVSPPLDMPLEEAMSLIRTNIVEKLQQSKLLEGGYRVMLAGTADKLDDTWKALRFNIILALLITYLLMAALFESWLYPLVIIFCVPLGAVGGILALSVLNMYFHQPLDVLTMLGFVILIGTVVNNPILIVHQSLNLMRDGANHRDAILESVRTRIRPIFMTTSTTVLGLLPLVLFPGSGSELYRGLGSVVLGGLVVSTIFTLLLVPTMFSLTLEAKRSVVRLLGFADNADPSPRQSPQAA